jgi:hypothetical protein
MEDLKSNNGRTLNALRTIVWDEIDKLRSGGTTAANVSAISNATGKILSSIKLEMEYVKLLGRTPNIAGILGELPPPSQPEASAKSQ